MKNKKIHVIDRVVPGSPAEQYHIEPGDALITINGEEIEDIFDYQFAADEKHFTLGIQKKDGSECEISVDKPDDVDFGLEFENGLMDDYRSCHNKCIFCFIDQMPKGMRETLYFKDDDSRLSFLQGNYVTLTNMSDHDVDRIIKYHMEPINISFQTMNPELRCTMLHNRFAGEALKKVDKFFEAGITMNGQIVLCKGVNDGKELEFSIREMEKYRPHLQSVSVVPVGLSKFREGLYPLEPFTKEDAREVIRMIEEAQKRNVEKWGDHFIHASDEWYILADYEMPPEENYDGYLQLENGVGMIRSMLDEFEEGIEALEEMKKHPIRAKFARREFMDVYGIDPNFKKKKKLSLATGRLAYPYIKRMADKVGELYPNMEIHVYEIVNHFFGEMITVSGLLTGQDIEAQLKEAELGDTLLLPENVLRSGENYFLDDMTVPELEKALQVSVGIVKSNGCEFIGSIVND